MPNGFVHVELHSDDAQQSKKFYKSLFDWKLRDIPDMTYTMIDVGKTGVGGGIGPRNLPVPAWLPYVEVASVKKSIAKAKSLGATIAVEYQPIGEMGAIGVFIDPLGAALGVWEMGKAAKQAPAPAKKKAAKKAAKKPAKKKAKKK
jgi:predicted enzyme related to lactoylglutathione lyase